MPGGFGVAEEDINCRCAILQRARWALDEAELQTLKDRAAYYGLDKADSFNEFKRKYLKAAHIVENTEKSGIIKTDRQFGKKVGKHAMDYGLDPSSSAGRKQMHSIIDSIYREADAIAYGSWRGQVDPVKFYIKGEDVVVATENDVFITILKGGASNARVKNARRR